MQLIDVKEAAKRMNCTIQNVYDLIKRVALRSVRRQNKMMTCQEWIEEYYEHVNSKEHHASINGRKIFTEDKPYYSLTAASEMLGIHRTSLFYHIKLGHVKAMKVKNYLAIPAAEVERLMAQNDKELEA